MKALITETTTKELTYKLKNEIPEIMEQHHVPGLSLTIIHEAKIFWSYAFGVKSSNTLEKVTEDTIFEAASLSKPVFAYAALKLCESGVLDLDVPLTNYLHKSFILNEPSLKQITMRHVLSHTTGFPNWRPKGKPLKMFFSPGERFSYSGEGYMYLQEVVAQVTGQDPVEYMSSNILKPLGMVTNSFVWKGQEDLPNAIGHDERGKVTKKRLWPEMYAAGSLHSTSIDFSKFMCAVMRPSPDNPFHLSQEMSKEMLTAQVQVNDSAPWDEDWPKPQIKINNLVGWGLGWGIQRTSIGNSFWHWGDNGNYRSFAVGLPEVGCGIVVMTNGKNGQKVVNHILYEIVGGDYPALDWLNG